VKNRYLGDSVMQLPKKVGVTKVVKFYYITDDDAFTLDGQIHCNLSSYLNKTPT
jgi:hypothetical protein